MRFSEKFIFGKNVNIMNCTSNLLINAKKILEGKPFSIVWQYDNKSKQFILLIYSQKSLEEYLKYFLNENILKTKFNKAKNIYVLHIEVDKIDSIMELE